MATKTETQSKSYSELKQEFGNIAKEHYYMIMQALRHRERDLAQEIGQAKESLQSDDGTWVYESLRNMIEDCERMERENKKTIEALKPAYDALR
jgi:hypothetical protein